jgi:hypothetical protein
MRQESKQSNLPKVTKRQLNASLWLLPPPFFISHPYPPYESGNPASHCPAICSQSSKVSVPSPNAPEAIRPLTIGGPSCMARNPAASTVPLVTSPTTCATPKARSDDSQTKRPLARGLVFAVLFMLCYSQAPICKRIILMCTIFKLEASLI